MPQSSDPSRLHSLGDLLQSRDVKCHLSPNGSQAGPLPWIRLMYPSLLNTSTWRLTGISNSKHPKLSSCCSPSESAPPIEGKGGGNRFAPTQLMAAPPFHLLRPRPLESSSTLSLTLIFSPPVGLNGSSLYPESPIFLLPLFRWVQATIISHSADAVTS